MMTEEFYTQEEMEMYQGEYPQDSGDHHQDLHDWNMQHNDSEAHAQQLLEEEKYGTWSEFAREGLDEFNNS
tara:strand:- start:1106 stop:1318 length:213 start_codon:yes stop_codon:yes gene_type:complete